VLPAGYLAWSYATSGDPFFFARYISHDHANLAAEVAARLGGVVARLRALAVWAIAFAFAMGPALLLALPAAVARWRRLAPATLVVVVTALAPTAAYVAGGLLLGSFEPLPRFGLAPGAVLLPLAAAALCDVTAGRRWLAPAPLVAGGALALSALALVLANGGFGPGRATGRIWTGAESLAPLTRLDAEDRALAEHIAAHRRPEEGVYLDTVGFADIVVAHAARVPAPRSVTLAATRDPFGAGGGTLAAARARTGAAWFAVHDRSWGRIAVADWPADSLRFGQWRLAHVGSAPVASRLVADPR